jgi:uncharacterized membrane protein
MPPATATLYILTTMGVVVVMVWAATGERLEPGNLKAIMSPIFILGVSTALSRLAMFSGVKILGSLQTAVVAIGEIGVALTLAYFVLGDRLIATQWLGVGLLFVSLLLVRPSDFKASNPGLMIVRDISNVQFYRIAFHRAFGTQEQDNEYGIMSKITTTEMESIRKMMGVKSGAVDPFPMLKNSAGNGGMDAFADTDEAETQPRPLSHDDEAKQ